MCKINIQVIFKLIKVLNRYSVNKLKKKNLIYSYIVELALPILYLYFVYIGRYLLNLKRTLSILLTLDGMTA